MVSDRQAVGVVMAGPITWTDLYAHIEQNFRASGRRYFTFLWSGAANDIISAYTPQLLIDESVGYGITVTNLEFDFRVTVGVVFWPFYIHLATNLNFTPPIAATAVAHQYYTWDNLELSCASSDLDIRNVMFRTIPTGWQAGDAGSVTIRGYIETTMQQGEVSPVSLEGYKWPLKRR